MFNSENQKLEQCARLKTLRIELGYKQGEFAQLVGLKQGSYSDIERGKNAINLKILGFLAKNYNVNANWLILGDGEIYLKKEKNLTPIQIASSYLEERLAKIEKDILVLQNK